MENLNKDIKKETVTDLVMFSGQQRVGGLPAADVSREERRCP